MNDVEEVRCDVKNTDGKQLCYYGNDVLYQHRPALCACINLYTFIIRNAMEKEQHSLLSRCVHSLAA